MVYVTGTTYSSDFPTFNAFQDSFVGATIDDGMHYQRVSHDAFVTKFKCVRQRAGLFNVPRWKL